MQQLTVFSSLQWIIQQSIFYKERCHKWQIQTVKISTFKRVVHKLNTNHKEFDEILERGCRYKNAIEQRITNQ